MSDFVGNSYNENYFHNFETVSGTTRLFKTHLYGQNGTTLYPLQTDASGNLLISGLLSTTFAQPITTIPLATSYLLSSASGWSGLPSTIQRGYDGKTISLSISGNYLTISDWA